jgi:hypothetical protein
VRVDKVHVKLFSEARHVVRFAKEFGENYPLCSGHFDVAYSRYDPDMGGTLSIKGASIVYNIVCSKSLDDSEAYLRERLAEQDTIIYAITARLPQPIAEEVVACLRA